MLTQTVPLHLFLTSTADKKQFSFVDSLAVSLVGGLHIVLHPLVLQS